ncbi:Flp pilus assembly complex ATPase component TadA [candidate division KSB1 bacterium]|nr:Flp pilus assembly complex ATPase component TadA [candidate division KSB1 bacterium]
MVNNENDKLSSVLSSLTSKIPRTLVGLERQEFIGQFIDKQPEQIKLFLREVIERYVLKMHSLEASDLDYGGEGCMGRIWYRIYGEKKPETRTRSWSFDETDVLLQNILMKSQKQHLYDYRYVDFSFEATSNSTKLRCRATIYFDLNHLAMNMRLINNIVRPLKELNFHPQAQKALNLKHIKSGLVLVTGITGSGKSSTLDSIIDLNNRSMNAHIVIISDPVEYVHEPKMSVVRHREIGRDVRSFKDGTIQALRQDPDIIVIGEMRDPETIMTVVEVADSGHKVFSTLHTSSARESIDRILGETDPNEQERLRERLSDVLTCVISQKLVPSKDGKRVLAKEVLLATPPIRSAIRNNNTEEIYQMIYQSNHLGMITMEQDLARLYNEHKISYEEGYNQANNKKRYEELVQFS